jgi:hypothetical protein
VCLEEMDGRHRQKEGVGLNAIYGAFAVTTLKPLHHLVTEPIHCRDEKARRRSRPRRALESQHEMPAGRRFDCQSCAAWLAVGQFIG